MSKEMKEWLLIGVLGGTSLWVLYRLHQEKKKNKLLLTACKNAVENAGGTFSSNFDSQDFTLDFDFPAASIGSNDIDIILSY